MNGIHYILDTYSIKKIDIAKAVQSVNTLNISINTMKHFLAEIVTLEDGESLPEINDSEKVRKILAYMVQVGLQRKVEKFSLQAFHDFSNRVGLTVEKREPEISVQKIIQEIQKSPKIESAEIQPVVKPAIVAQEQIKRNRKIDPNSNLSRAKILYQNAIDKSRDSIVQLFQRELGIESGTATTYYYLAKKS